MDMKVQGSRGGKTLGIGELFARACSVSAPLDRSYNWGEPERAPHKRV